MLAKAILSNQLGKLLNFVYLLIFLFVVNTIFNINLKWEGVSIILKVYMFIFSFYLIFNFSQLKISYLKDEFRNLYGKWGIYVLFFVIRVIPYGLIYTVSATYTYIHYIGLEGWPWNPTFDLLYGKNTNHIFMSVVLLIVLKIKKDPKITIPIFLALIASHFIFYKTFYRALSTGLILTWVKVIEFILLTFSITYEFFLYDRKFIKSLFISIFLGITVYWAQVGVHYSIYKLTDEVSYSKYRASRTLLKLGYSFPLDAYKKLVFEQEYSDEVSELIFYSEKYGKNINFTDEQWQMLLESTEMQGIDSIVSYLMKNKIFLSHEIIIDIAKRKSKLKGKSFITARNLIKYSAIYYKEYSRDFLAQFEKENYNYKIWLIRVIAESGSIETIPFLIELLTGIDENISIESYDALVKITSLNPASKRKIDINDPFVISKFRVYYFTNR